MPAVLLKLYQPGGKTVYPYPSILSILVKMDTEKKKWHLLFQQQIFFDVYTSNHSTSKST